MAFVRQSGTPTPDRLKSGTAQALKACRARRGGPNTRHLIGRKALGASLAGRALAAAGKGPASTWRSRGVLWVGRASRRERRLDPSGPGGTEPGALGSLNSGSFHPLVAETEGGSSLRVRSESDSGLGSGPPHPAWAARTQPWGVGRACFCASRPAFRLL